MPTLRANQGTNTSPISKSGITEGDIYASTSYGGINAYTTLPPPTIPDETDMPEKPVEPIAPNEPVPTFSLFPNKTDVVADATDEVVWENLPPKTHWTTYQTVLGGSNEYDYEGGQASLTFAPAGTYYIIIVADGFAPTLVTITATEPEVLEG